MTEDQPATAPQNSDDTGEEPCRTVGNNAEEPQASYSSLLSRFIKDFMKKRQDTSLREAIEEYIDNPDEEGEVSDSISLEEKALFSNVLKLRDTPVTKLMIPRADIVAIDVNTPPDQLLAVLAQKQYSRIPVYQDTLDEVLGTVHIKDIIGELANGREIIIHELLKEIPIVSPAMPALDLLITMRETRRHMALVVDEYGGIDGLVTIGDLIEAIAGVIDDEHDVDEEMMFADPGDGTVVADARADIEEFEKEYGSFFSEEEREESETLGGLVFMLAGRVPVRGEVLTHDSGLVFKILDADHRRIKRLKICDFPT